MEKYVLIYSTISFGKRIETPFFSVAFDLEDAERHAPLIEGLKFERAVKA